METEIGKKLRRRIVLLIFVAVLPYLVTTITPTYQGIEILPGSSYSTTHLKDNGYYRLKVEKGNHYWFDVTEHVSYTGNPQIIVYSHAFKLVGRIGSPMEFIAKHSGHYFVTITDSKGGYFIIRLTEMDHFTTEYNPSNIKIKINPWKIGIAVLPIILFPLGLIRLVKTSRKKSIQLSHDIKMRNSKTCPMCGDLTEKRTEYCKYCGYTFEKPKFLPPQDLKEMEKIKK